MSNTTWIVTCRKCKLTRRFEAPEVSRRTVVVRGHYPSVTARETYDATLSTVAAAPFTSRGDVAVDEHDRRGSIWLKCPAGHSCEAHRMIGRTTEHKCGAKCVNSKGHVCECACGGKNHGAGWAE
jgi:hypothetical protein